MDDLKRMNTDDVPEMISLQYAAARNELVRCNTISERFGLALSEEAMEHLIIHRFETLRDTGRVEFGEGVLGKLIFAFCDSPYIEQSSYEEVLLELQELFYSLKNECRDLVSDDELIEAMRLIFNETARGSMAFLAGVEWKTMCRIAQTGSLQNTELSKKVILEGFDDEEYE